MGIIVGTPHTKGAGYFVNDKALRTRQQGDVQTCSHCQGVLIMQQWKDNGAWCGKCMRPICNEGECAKQTALYGCVPFLRKIEQYAEAQMRFEKFYKDAGLEPAAPQTILPPVR